MGFRVQGVGKEEDVVLFDALKFNFPNTTPYTLSPTPSESDGWECFTELFHETVS